MALSDRHRRDYRPGVAKIASGSSGARLVLVSGWTGVGKSTLANALATDMQGTTAGFDWLMSGLRAFPEIWPIIEQPRERQREIGWALLSRVAEQQLRRSSTCVLDVVAREVARARWQLLATETGVSFHVIECVCSDPELHRKLVEGRKRTIPAWYEISFEDALRVRRSYLPLEEPKLVVDAADGLEQNLIKARAFLGLTGD